MFSDIISIMKTAITQVFSWTTQIFDRVGALPFVMFFVLLSAFLIRVLPQLVNRSGSDPVTNSARPRHLMQSLDSPEPGSTSIVVRK